MATQTLAQYLATARRYRQSGEKTQIALMYLLLEVEEQRAIWHDDYASWGALLKAEALCTVSRYTGFKFSTKYFKRDQLELLGLSACITASRVPPKHRAAVIKEMWVWHEQHGIPLQYQTVAAIIDRIAPRSSPSLKGKGPHQMLSRHVKRLEVLLTEKGIEVPKMDEANDAEVAEGTPLDAAVAFIRAKWAFKKHFPSATDEDVLKMASSLVGASSGDLKRQIGGQGRPKPASKPFPVKYDLGHG